MLTFVPSAVHWQMVMDDIRAWCRTGWLFFQWRPTMLTSQKWTFNEKSTSTTCVFSLLKKICGNYFNFIYTEKTCYEKTIIKLFQFFFFFLKLQFVLLFLTWNVSSMKLRLKNLDSNRRNGEAIDKQIRWPSPTSPVFITPKVFWVVFNKICNIVTTPSREVKSTAYTRQSSHVCTACYQDQWHANQMLSSNTSHTSLPRKKHVGRSVRHSQV